MAFEARHYSEALSHFLDVLRRDPANAPAHHYVDAIGRAMMAQQQGEAEQQRLTMLRDLAAQGGVTSLPEGSLRSAIDDTVLAESRTRQAHWQARLEEARLQAQQHHWLAAFDITLKVLEEDPASSDARRTLSDLQSSGHDDLAHTSEMSSEERYALEGFFAYSQADYAAATSAWGKAQELGRTGSSKDPVLTATRLHFLPYLDHAVLEVAEERRRSTQAALFQRGRTLLDEKRYAESLQSLRELALQNPEYPALAPMLVQAELAAEKERSRHLSEQRRQEVARLLQRANDFLQRDQPAEAEDVLTDALRLDPTNPQLRSHLALARDERSRRYDPKGADEHYQNGMGDAAAGRMDDALREFQVTLRMNPKHERAIVALGKIKRQLAYEREAP